MSVLQSAELPHTVMSSLSNSPGLTNDHLLLCARKTEEISVLSSTDVGWEPVCMCMYRITPKYPVLFSSRDAR